MHKIDNSISSSEDATFAIVPTRHLTSGESATLELTPNPARTDIDQNKVTKSCTAP